MKNLKVCDAIANEYSEVLFSLYKDVWKEWKKGSHGEVTLKDDTKAPIYFTNSYDEITNSSSLFYTNLIKNDIKTGTLILATKRNHNTAILFRYGQNKIVSTIKKYETYFTVDDVICPYSNGGLYGSYLFIKGVKIMRTKSEAFQNMSLVSSCLLKTKHILTKANLSKGGKTGNKFGNHNAKQNIVTITDKKGNISSMTRKDAYNLFIGFGYNKSYNIFVMALNRKKEVIFNNCKISSVKTNC